MFFIMGVDPRHKQLQYNNLKSDQNICDWQAEVHSQIIRDV